MPLLAGTRNAGKLREMRPILKLFGFELRGADEVLGPSVPDEDEIEVHDTFEDNAAAKARYYAARSGLATIADDSGLCVDALGGAPGVRSARFADDRGIVPEGAGDGDARNLATLLELLRDVPEPERTARYVCAVAFASSSGEVLIRTAACEGTILFEPRGGGGFGYDPVFFVPAETASFAELPAARKHRLSHRGRALRKIAPLLGDRVDEISPLR